MAKTLGPVALKLGDEVLVKLRKHTPIKDLLEQLDRACKGGRIGDVEGFDVTAHYPQDLPEGEYAIKQPVAGNLAGELFEEGSAPSKRAKSGHSSQALLVEQSEHLVKQHLFEPLPDPALPRSDSQVLQWLFDFTELKVPVTAVYYQQMLALQGPQRRLVPEVDAASAVVTFTELLQTPPDLPFSSEMDTSVYTCNFVGRVWRTLANYSPTSLQYNLFLNKASQLSSVSSHAIARRLRPDTMLVAESCTLMLGEDKHTDLAAAYADLERKRVDLSGMHYGPLKFMLGYAAAGTAMQWCFLPCHTDQPVQVMGPRLDFRNAKDRLSFLLSLVQAYRLLSVMSAAVPQLPGRWPLYSQIERENSIVLMEGTTVFKQIKNFKGYEKRQKTSFAAIQKAYATAGRAADEAKRAGDPQYLVSCTSPPRLDLHAMATACCKAAQVLHNVKLVHRDLRLPNVVQLEHQQYMVIDLESVAELTTNRLPEKFHCVLKTCNSEALDAAGCFTALSDMYCIGLLLKEAHASLNSPPADAFVHKLMAKELTAEAALMFLRHEWSP